MYVSDMEPTLREHLLALKSAYIGAVKASESTVAQQACGDWRFFDRIQTGSSFTARTYDKAVQWFADRWPAGLDWPEGVPSPAPADVPRPEPTPSPASATEAA